MHVVISFVFFLVLFNGAESEVPADSVVPVKPLDPIPQYHFQLSDLPPPYNTTSVQKDGKVVSMPNDAFLNVPRGFKVHVFAQNLTGPRWLQLTPNGDVLVAEMSENRLILLKVLR